FSDEMTRWFSALAAARSPGQKLRQLLRLPVKRMAPVIALMRGLTDPVVNLLMGQTAENLAWKFNITRRQQDEFAANSHLRVLAAQQAGNFADEIVPMVAPDGRVIDNDDGVRADSTPDNLAKLKPFFDRNYGSVTAGNSSQVTDGATCLLLASEEAVRHFGLDPMGRILDSQWAGLDPAQMGLGPVHAATPILQRQGLGLNDIDAWEINEAFAAQMLACLAAWNDADYCRDQLELSGPLGELDMSKLNIDGGAIALGHPVGASGARIVLHLLQVLRRQQQLRGVEGLRGIAAICIGGGQGGAMLVEALS
ncbi:MAG TPA: acetyl-CoA C-acyltransferase, partial [Rhodocyclaceae bacterium]